MEKEVFSNKMGGISLKGRASMKERRLMLGVTAATQEKAREVVKGC